MIIKFIHQFQRTCHSSQFHETFSFWHYELETLPNVVQVIQ